MTNVHILPLRLDADAGRRLSNELTAAFNSGADLGSRIPHIQKQVQLLHYQEQLLRAKLDEIAASAGVDDPESREIIAQIETILQLVDRMITVARKLVL